MPKIIGHRGAAGLALENSRASLLAALTAGVDMIELDAQLTADDKLVVMHYPKTGRVARQDVAIGSKTLAELRKIGLNNGERLLSLDEALDILGDIPVIIDVKRTGSVDELLLVLGRHPKARPRVASFFYHELEAIQRALPDVPIYVLEHFAPLDIVRRAHKLRAAGIGLNKWLMNPLTYRLARHYQLELYLYTVNSRLLARFLRKLYPAIHLCTDHPERFVKPEDD